MKAAHRARSLLLLLGAVVFARCQSTPEPSFYFGADLSYVNEMEDCGAIYREDGEAQDPFALFAAHGTNLVRARLWHSPNWTEYSTLEDVKRTFSRAEEAGMGTVLDFHYSDNWADPGRQEIPAAWASITDTDELAQALYDHTYDVLLDLDDEGLMPDFIQVGNEVNSGMLKDRVRLDWPRDAVLFQAGIRAVRDAAEETGTNPQIILHVAQPENAVWWFREATEAGIDNFDVIGISYYPQWSEFSISGMGSVANYLHRTYDKEIMVMEAGYPWTLESVSETASNVLTQGQRAYPIEPQGQLQFMRDLTQSLISNAAIGVVYWEPAWVSTSCSTRWGQGSHWENATFFDFANNNELNVGIDYMSAEYTEPKTLSDGLLEEEYTDPILADGTGDALNDLGELDLVSLHMLQSNDNLSFALGVGGDVLANPGNVYRVYLDTTENTEGGGIDIGKRPIEVAYPYLPEFIIEIQIVEARGVAMPQAALFTWSGSEWQESAWTGGMAVSTGYSSTIEFELPIASFGDPSFINLAALSAGRVLTRTAADVLGTDFIPTESTDVVVLSDFVRLDFGSD